MTGAEGPGRAPAHIRAGTPQPPTSLRRAVIVGGLIAILVGATSGLVTARLTDRVPELASQRAEIARLTADLDAGNERIEELVAEVDAASDSEDIDRLSAEVAGLETQVAGLERQVEDVTADRQRLEGELAVALNPSPAAEPAPPPAATAVLAARYVKRHGGGENTVICIGIGNTSTDPLDIGFSYSQFTVVDGDNYVYTARLHTPGYSTQLPTPLLYGQLAPGERARGQLLFSMPVGATPARLIWSTDFATPSEITIELPEVSAGYEQYSGASKC
jgi:outer membrane murein-binding lipoprotein Lpp